MNDRIYYAIGDIHGEAERLALLHDFIFEDARRLGAPATIVHVGDLIDRGPDSHGVVARTMALEKSSAHPVVTLMGNHEQMMLQAFDNEDPAYGLYSWAANGGEQTIASYMRANGVTGDWRDALDRDHLHWLRALPKIWTDEDRKIAFVHAGIDPKTFPECNEEVRLWTRSPKFFDTDQWPKRRELEGWQIVHGHTPTEDHEPYADPRRINVDTGVCWGGPLTCAILAPGEPPRFLKT